MQQNKIFGASLSYKQCEVFKVDWVDCLNLASELGLKVIRLPVYWSDIQRHKGGELDFSILKQQLKILQKYDFDICLQFGIKSLWWPEFYFPEGESYQGLFDKNESQEQYFDYLKELIDLVDDNQQITSYQLENEPFNPSGKNKKIITQEFFTKELKFIRNLTDKKILTSAWIPSFTQGAFNKLLNQDLDLIGIHYYYDFPKPKFNYTDIYTFNLLKLKLRLIGKEKRSKIIISELQAQPWLSKNIRSKESDSSYFQNKLQKIIDLPVNEFWFWGLEFWQFRKKHYQDDSWMEMVKKLLY